MALGWEAGRGAAGWPIPRRGGNGPHAGAHGPISPTDMGSALGPPCGDNQSDLCRLGLNAYFTTYITSFTALTVRSTLGREASMRLGAKGRGVSAWFTRTTGASRKSNASFCTR